MSLTGKLKLALFSTSLSILFVPQVNQAADGVVAAFLDKPPAESVPTLRTPFREGDYLGGFLVTSEFYPCETEGRSDCRSFGSGRHRGIDLATPQGTVIYAPTEGRSYCGFEGVEPVGTGWGSFVVWDGGGQHLYLIGHLSACYEEQTPARRAFAKSGGRKGSKGAGTSTGPHVHLEKIRKAEGVTDVWEHLRSGTRELLVQEEREFLERFFSRQ